MNAGGGINSLGGAITTNAIQQDKINQANAKIQAQEQIAIARRGEDVAKSFIALEEKRLKKLNEAIDVFDGLDTVARTLTGTFNKLDSALIEIFKIIEFFFPKNDGSKQLTGVEKLGENLGKIYKATPFIPNLPRTRNRLSENN